MPRSAPIFAYMIAFRECQNRYRTTRILDYNYQIEQKYEESQHELPLLEQSEKSLLLDMCADNHPCKFPLLISCNTSVLASCLSKKTPRIALVVIIEFCFLTPLHFIHPCWASRITAHPRGRRFSTISSARPSSPCRCCTSRPAG